MYVKVLELEGQVRARWPDPLRQWGMLPVQIRTLLLGFAPKQTWRRSFIFVCPSPGGSTMRALCQVRLVFIARTDIKAGQELTFDYRFKEEEGVEKVPCRCGAPNCRGSLN